MGIPMYFVLPRKLQEYYIRTKRFELVHIISQDHESDLQGTLSNVLVITFIVSPKQRHLGNQREQMVTKRQYLS